MSRYLALLAGLALSCEAVAALQPLQLARAHASFTTATAAAAVSPSSFAAAASASASALSKQLPLAISRAGGVSMMGVKRKKMETKKSSKNKAKAAAATDDAKGFGEPVAAAPPPTEAPPPTAADEDQMPQEPASMEAVAAAQAMNAAQQQQAEPPPDGSSPPGCEAVFALASAELLSSLRVGSLASPPKYAAVYSALQAAVVEGEAKGSDQPIIDFVQANRDLLDYRFLYRLTGEKILAENTNQADKAKTLNNARTLAVRYCQRFDTALFKQVAVAENALGGLLAQFMMNQGQGPSAKQVVDAARGSGPGSGPQATFAFWMVMVAAIAAWEAKLPVPTVTDQAKAKLKELDELRTALEGDEELMKYGGISPLHKLFNLPDLSMQLGYQMIGPNDKANARSLLEELVPDEGERLMVLRRIGCMACQVQRHGFQAYNPMTQRAAALYDVLYHGELQPLDAPDIQSPEREGYSSRMVKMAYDAQPFLEEQQFDIPLFW